MRPTVQVFAPVSIGNVSVGFDSLGLALQPIDGSLLGDVVTVESHAGGNEFVLQGSYADRLPKDKESNIVWDILLTFTDRMRELKVPTETVKITLDKNIPVCSGTGSSACSVVAALVALNDFYGKPFDDDNLLSMMGEAEAKISGSLHYDNVAPCFYGGLQLMIPNQQQVALNLPVFDSVYWVLAYPDVLISTQAARDLLPKQYDRETLIRFGQNLAGFVAASYEKKLDLAFALITDEVAEPYRARLLPDYAATKQALLDMNSLAVGISGSGPTIFSACRTLEDAQKQASWLTKNYLQTDEGFVSVCQIDQQGTRNIS